MRCLSFKKYSFILAGFLFIIFFLSCDLITPRAKIAVISDLHYFNQSLLISDGSAFQQYLMQDRKLLKESAAILESAISSIEQSDAEIVLVPGDLTKDGELVNHLRVALMLKRLEQAGKKVFVVPGNHDINNPDALSFNGDAVNPVARVNAAQFKVIYKKYGYGEAISTDKHSLSYVVEPVPGLWIIAMDSCKYDTNLAVGEPEISGAFSEATLSWIRKQLKNARRRGKTVLGMMHHGLLEHYQGQKLLFPEYIIDGNDAIAEMFADSGMKAVFTGHYHAQDVMKKESASKNVIYDIETGSLITYPCPYRVVELDSQSMTISTSKIDTINYPLPEGMQFGDYAKLDLQNGLNILIYYMLTSGAFSVGGNQLIITPQEAEMVVPLMTAAFMAHYSGDEMPDATTLAIIQQLVSGPSPTMNLLGQALGGLWIDPAPADNNLVIEF